MENVDITDIGKKIKELVAENESLRGTKNSLPELAKLLEKAISDLQAALTLVKPSIHLKFRSKSGIQSGSRIVKDAYDNAQALLLAGTHVTTAFLETTHPNLPKPSLYKIFAKLRQLPNIKEVRDGRCIRLFA